IRKIAPAAATALGGPLAGTAAAVIAGKIGVSDPTPAAIAKAVQANPEIAARLAEIDADLAKAQLLDTQDARRTLGTARWGYVIDTAVLLLVVLVICLIAWAEIPAAAQQA
ncbi:hypothetical protein RCK87_24820, partial [Salmonella enterica subsp. enterica serovar 1,4,[5],12:i:-]